MVDLHTHTDKSDGTLMPTALVELACAKGLTAVAITDHDCVDGIEEALAAGQNKDICVIPGVELSTAYGSKEIHMVGLFIDYTDEVFNSRLKEFVSSRINRNHKMCDNLREAGIDISFSQLCDEFPDCVITRAHYAAYLEKYGYVKSKNEAFDRYLGDHTKYFVARKKVTPSEAIELIHSIGGLSILAHPPLYHMGNEAMDKLVGDLAKQGLDGIEVLYSSYNGQNERDMLSLAGKYNLLMSGGSDFHGSNKKDLELGTGYGKLCVPDEFYIRMRDYENTLY